MSDFIILGLIALNIFLCAWLLVQDTKIEQLKGCIDRLEREKNYD